MNRKMLSSVVTGIVLFMAFMAGWYFTEHFRYSLTPSLRYSFFYIKDIKQGNILKNGDYVIVRLDPSDFAGVESFDKPVKLIKEVGCVEGEMVTVIDREYFCGAAGVSVPETMDDIRASSFVSLGKARGYSSEGVKLQNFIYNGVVPKGSFFLTGHHKDSLDSRYLGFVQENKVESVAYPIF